MSAALPDRMLMPPISRYMNCQPWTIRRDATMSQAHRMMREHHIRHLPVLEGGALVGLVSERDLHLMETLPDADPDQVTVEDAMSADVYSVGPQEPVDAVVERMASRKLGSVVVVDRRGAVEGIFTTLDALQVLAEVLQRTTA
jgi:acetoin utilization protein AcuB